MDLTQQTIGKLRQMLDSKEISAPELTQSYLDRIAKYDDTIQSYITVTAERALADAAAAQKKIDAGNAGVLCGIPMAIKDNICTDGIKTTCASKMLEDFIPPYNATVMEKLAAQDIVMLGKASMDEFAMGGSTQTSAFAKTRNPFNTECVPGGSSGGSAASVSASLAAAALGSDTGGSIRQPAAFCGVTGLKPTYGRVSRYGLVAFASSLDQIGPIAKNAQDCAWILNAIAGFDPHDGTSSKRNPEDYTAKLGKDIKGLKIAIPKEFYAEGIDDEVRNAVMQAARTYEKMGAELVECSMPSLKYAVAAYYLIASAEASSNLSRYDGIKYGHRSKVGDTFQELICNSRSEGFGSEVKRRILLGNYALSSGYTHLQVAMPSSFGLWFGAYAESLADDLLALKAAYDMVNTNPLGSGAGYGSSIALNRQMTTDLLGFSSLAYNVVYAQMQRGKMEKNVLFGLAAVATTLGRLAADVCLFACNNFVKNIMKNYPTVQNIV